jgi:ATP-dependent Clp protease ATP-binding subunit ClpX
MEYQLGARGLRSICEVIMTELMYDSADSKSKTITIDENLAHELFEKNNTFALAS